MFRNNVRVPPSYPKSWPSEHQEPDFAFCLLPTARLVYSSTLNMQTVCYSGRSTFIVRNVSFIVCVAWCAVLFERGEIFCVLCLIVVPLPPGKPPLAVQLNNNKVLDYTTSYISRYALHSRG
jgi:hypothetical protein